MAPRTSPSGARSARRADERRVERYAALLDRQLRGRGVSATDALEEALGQRGGLEAGRIVGEFGAAICAKGEWRERAAPAPFPCEGLPPLP